VAYEIRLLARKETAGKALVERKANRALLGALRPAAFLGIEMVLTRLASDKLAVSGDADPLAE